MAFTDLPLGLPDGSVRAALALVLTVTTAYLWATAQVVPDPLLVTTTAVVTYYFASRNANVDVVNAVRSEEEIDAPYIPANNG